jgi:hypothetical protein
MSHVAGPLPRGNVSPTKWLTSSSNAPTRASLQTPCPRAAGTQSTEQQSKQRLEENRSRKGSSQLAKVEHC